MTVSIQAEGGLCNQLFMIAAAYAAAKRHATTFTVSLKPEHRHTVPDLKPLVVMLGGTISNNRAGPTCTCKPFSDDTARISQTISTHGNVHLSGVFQSIKFMHPFEDKIREAVLAFLNQRTTMTNFDGSGVTFYHIRGGDYHMKQHSCHLVDLKKYYETCFTRDKRNKKILFTNDKAYAKHLLPDLQATDANTIDTLFMMSKCSHAVCANSSFSWWGAFLGPALRHGMVFMPCPWIKGYEFHGVYPPYATVLP